MTWVKLDDRFAEAPKVEALSDAAFRVHVRGMCYSAAYRTDGWVPRQVAKRWGEQAVQECGDAGVWHVGDNLCKTCSQLLLDKAGLNARAAKRMLKLNVYVHNFLDYNPSRSATEIMREAGRSRQERWRERVSNGVTDALLTASRTRSVATQHGARTRARRGKEPLPAAPQPPRYQGRCDKCGMLKPCDCKPKGR